ncbi:phosphatase PAP2 family protein [Streptacidiphilus sp. ASG 303]|uniref:diacylglycerol kinase family protein n=1 Tax=Streptacidiphilus sp. ASG 303 TaxID=2896847 RepID=UPI001E5A46DF|nr:diacylglycerol kinase family protein [Streptacidiphilus sp. ASG 303]MCD0481364.1 phosphatase PAP2 family protein [Streptacidiphilus sp. ASG 303]
MLKESGPAARRIGVLLLGQAALMVGLGLLLTLVMAHHLPVSAEDNVNRFLAAHRTPTGNTVTSWFSTIANTPAVVTGTAVCIAALLLLPRLPRWREAVFLGGAVAVQSAVFLLVTLCVERPRPEVHHLDGAPPTSSFPSGHTGASTALYGGLAVLALSRLRGPWRYVAAAVLFLVPPAVAVSRLYRGMHHPTDVLGGLVNGTCALLVMGRTLLARRSPWVPGRPAPAAASASAAASTASASTAPVAAPRPRAAGLRAAVVHNPTVTSDDLRARLRAVLDRHGYTDQAWTETTVDDPGGGPAAAAAASGADLVVVCGGDGTVMACAGGLCGTGTPMAVVPCGTGNLLARNLGLPLDPVAALDDALGGEPAPVDLGVASGDGLEPTCFTVMAGAGFDAAMVRDASDRLKARLGWVAYLLSAARHLRDPRMRITLRLDGGPVLHRRARMAVVGNVGSLQGGLPLLPDARHDSGRMDVLLLDPRGPAGWIAAAGHLGARMLPGRDRTPEQAAPTRRAARGALEYFTAARVELDLGGPQPRELDGDAVADGRTLVVEVRPGALLVRLPADRAAGRDRAAGSGTADRAPAAREAGPLTAGT